MDGKPQEIEISSLKMQKTLNNWGKHVETCGNMDKNWHRTNKWWFLLCKWQWPLRNGVFCHPNIIWTLAPCCGHGNMIFKTTVGVQCSNWGQIHGGGDKPQKHPYTLNPSSTQDQTRGFCELNPPFLETSGWNRLSTSMLYLCLLKNGSTPH